MYKTISEKQNREKMNYLYRVSLICGVAPLTFGGIIFLSWYFTEDNKFIALGIFTLYCGIASAIIGTICLSVYLLRQFRINLSFPRNIVKRGLLSGSVLAILITALIGAYDHRWDIYMMPIPNMHDFSIDTTGYTIEPLPFTFCASFVRGDTVYFADSTGRVFKADDSDPIHTRTLIGHSHVSPRMLFVSSKGTIFVAGGGSGSCMKRSTDGGSTWEQVLNLPFWRMDEDDATSTLYAGNYSPRNHPVEMATLFKSTDEGKTWQKVFADERLDHIHTVRFDPKHRRIYIATGDESSRGQVYSDDQGKSWQWIVDGRGNGHTDLAISDEFVFWGSDDSYGRVIRSLRNPVSEGETLIFARYHQIWWIIAKSQQIYAGTFSEDAKSLSGAFLMASSDQGRNWQKLMEIGKAGPQLKAFDSESRNISSNGWVYFSTTTPRKSYRVRKENAIYN